MMVDVPFADIGTTIAPVDVADAAVGELNIRDDLAKLEQESHGLSAFVADGIMWVLDQNRFPAYSASSASVKL